MGDDPARVPGRAPAGRRFQGVEGDRQRGRSSVGRAPALQAQRAKRCIYLRKCWFPASEILPVMRCHMGWRKHAQAVILGDTAPSFRIAPGRQELRPSPRSPPCLYRLPTGDQHCPAMGRPGRLQRLPAQLDYRKARGRAPASSSAPPAADLRVLPRPQGVPRGRPVRSVRGRGRVGRVHRRGTPKSTQPEPPPVGLDPDRAPRTASRSGGEGRRGPRDHPRGQDGPVGQAGLRSTWPTRPSTSIRAFPAPGPRSILPGEARFSRAEEGRSLPPASPLQGSDEGRSRCGTSSSPGHPGA